MIVEHIELALEQCVEETKIIFITLNNIGSTNISINDIIVERTGISIDDIVVEHIELALKQCVEETNIIFIILNDIRSTGILVHDIVVEHT